MIETKTKRALDGVRILDMTHVQSGPSCTQILAWLGADVIKVELPGRGDITRQQLRDIPDVDSLYFTMLNGNKRSLTLNTKTPQGKAIFTKLIQACDVLGREFRPRRARSPRVSVGEDPGAQPADDLRLDQRLRAGTVRRRKSLRTGCAGDGRLDEHDRLGRGSAARHGRANRRLGYRHSRGRCDSCGALPARRAHRRRTTRRVHDARFGAQSLPREDARSAAARARAVARVSESNPSTASYRVRAMPRAEATRAPLCVVRPAVRTTTST